MNRMLLCVLCLGAVAWGGEKTVRDSDGRPLVPIAKIKCLPMFEVKDISATWCKVAGVDPKERGESRTHALVATITFLHRVTDRPVDVTVTCDMAPNGSMTFAGGAKQVDTVQKVPPETPTRIRLIYEDFRNHSGDRLILHPVVSFSWQASRQD